MSNAVLALRLPAVGSAPRWFRATLQRPQILTGCALLLLIVLLAMLAPLAIPLQTVGNAPLDLPPSAAHLMGTGTHANDIFTEWIYAARFSLKVGFAAGIGSTLLSILVGVTAGYLGGWADDALNFVIRVFLLMPPLPLLYVLALGLAIVGAWPLIALLTFTTWANGATLLRSQALSLRRHEFVEAAIAIGESPWRAMLNEVLPHLTGLIAFVLISAVLFALQSEFALEFLGWGVGGSSGLGGGWGIMMANALFDADLYAGYWWTWVFPGLGITITSAALALISTGLGSRASR